MNQACWELPAHGQRELAPKRTRFCVGIPVLNEGERILRQLVRMKDLEGIPDLIIADGGSTDGAVSVERMESLGVRTLLIKEGPGCLGAQLRMLFAYALQEGYEGCLLIDGNDKDDVRFIPDFVSKLEQGFDFIQGSRFLPGGSALHNPLHRKWAIRLLHAPLISLAAGYRYTDTTNGFRAFSARFLEDPRVDPFRSIFSGYELPYYLAIRAARLGFQVSEIPVSRHYPPHQPIPTKISFLRGNLAILRALLQVATHRFDPKPLITEETP